MQFSRVFALLMTLVSGATVLEAIGLPRQQNASLVAKRDTGEAESCYLSEYGLHSISGYTIDIDDCDAIVSTAQALESTGVSYYWSLNAGEKGWHCTFPLQDQFSGVLILLPFVSYADSELE